MGSEDQLLASVVIRTSSGQETDAYNFPATSDTVEVLVE